MISQKGLFSTMIAGRSLPYNMFCIVGIAVLLFNILLSVFWPFHDFTTVGVFSAGIVLLLAGMYIFRFYSTFVAILLVIIVYNTLIFWVSFNLGRSSGAMLYYFPLMVGFLYLFLYNSNLAKTITQILIMLVFALFTVFYTQTKSTHFFLPDPVLEKVYLLNLLFSIIATIIVLVFLYRQFASLHRSVLLDKEMEHRKRLRDLDLEREKQGYALLLSLRDNISQTLASSRMYLQMHPEHMEFTRKADEQVKEALAGLNDISVELSPSMLIDLGIEDGLETYATLLTDKYGIPVQIELDKDSEEIPEVERLSLYRILQQCINIIAETNSIEFLHVQLKKEKRLSLQFEHDSDLNDFSRRFLDTRHRDLTTRLNYYSAVIREESGKVEVELDVSA
jgi:signal transduction histidine kinase